ncbi:MAG TPA: ABC transporter ATP-binding protein [Mogibacterium sp.]|nr:ABC transporter ATP-binding protein [Mogibacterium sp.]
MIEIRDLYKKFGKTEALAGINLTIQKASIYGLVGTNGAGKTTIIKHMAGVLKSDAGEILYDGEPVFENVDVKQKIGLIPDELYFPNNYSIKDMVRQYAATYENWNEERCRKLTELFKLDPNASLRSFSKGMKKQAMFALTLAKMPQYLLLDEPIDGLDPIVRKLVWKQIVDDTSERGTTVLVSSHNLRDMETICDYIGIIDNGKTVIEREIETVRDGLSKVQVAFSNENRTKGEEAIAKLDVLHRDSHGSISLLIVREDIDVIRKTLEGIPPLLLDILPLSLEEVFIYELGGQKYDFKDIL